MKLDTIKRAKNEKDELKKRRCNQMIWELKKKKVFGIKNLTIVNTLLGKGQLIY